MASFLHTWEPSLRGLHQPNASRYLQLNIIPTECCKASSAALSALLDEVLQEASNIAEAGLASESLLH